MLDISTMLQRSVLVTLVMGVAGCSAPTARVAPATSHTQEPAQSSVESDGLTEQKSTEQKRRCPDPFAGEGVGWVPKAPLDPEEARLMNERQGLICSERSGRTGCVNAQGRAVIPFVYEELTYFSDSGVALIRHPDQGWLYIDRRNQLIGKALLLDNIPDESFGGLARFQAPSGKIGYLDRERRVAIPAKYDAAYPFRNCTALVCIGCHHNRWSKDGPERAACTGKAFVIDESGKKLKEDSGVDWEGCEQK